LLVNKQQVEHIAKLAYFYSIFTGFNKERTNVTKNLNISKYFILKI
tara:strand:- start:471 stop:608 length:138 start_codon:yes stop_codon:yes gene_type:complete